jgi:hypothetical protein
MCPTKEKHPSGSVVWYSNLFHDPITGTVSRFKIIAIEQAQLSKALPEQWRNGNWIDRPVALECHAKKAFRYRGSVWQYIHRKRSW